MNIASGTASMLPMVDAEVLEENPQFKVLYQQLVSKALNPDGSTKDEEAEQRRAAVRLELYKYRLKAAKQHLLSDAIASAVPQDPKSSNPSSSAQHHRPSHAAGAAEPLLDLLFLLPILLDTERSLPADAVGLLFSSPPLSQLEDLLPDLASITSTALRSSALSLSRIAHPTTNPSYLHRHISSLSQDFSALLAAHAETHNVLLSKRHHMLSSFMALLETYTQVLTHLVEIMETKYSQTSRHLELRARQVSLQSQLTEQDIERTKVDLHNEVYDAKTVTALKNYLAHLRDAKVRVAERTKGLEAELREFGVGVDEEKETIMTTLAKEYKRLKVEKTEIIGDLDKLEDT